MPGLARIRFTGQVLAEALHHVPRAMELVGAEPTLDGTLALLFTCEDVPVGEVVDMRLEVCEEPTRRTVSIVKVA